MCWLVLRWLGWMRVTTLAAWLHPSNTLGVLGTALATLMLTNHAHAQAPIVEGPATAPVERGSILDAWGSQPHAPGSYALAATLYVWTPATEPGAAGSAQNLDNPGDSGAGVSPGISTVEALLSVGISGDFDLSAGLSSHRGPFGASGDESQVLGDLRLVPRLRLLGEDDGGLALLLPMSAPITSSARRALTESAIEPRLAVHVGGERVVVTMNAGYRTRPWAEDRSMAPTNVMTGAVGTEVRLFEHWSLLAEVTGQVPLAFISASSAAAGAQVRAGVRYAFSSWAAQLAAGAPVPGLERDAAWQVLSSVSFTPSFSYYQNPSKHDVPKQNGDETPLVSEDTYSHEPSAHDDDSQALAVHERGSRADRDGSDHTSAPEVSTNSQGSYTEEIREVIWFEVNHAHIDPKYEPALDALAQRLKAVPGRRIIIEGHSDKTGPARFNHELSRMRASTVRYHLFLRGVAWHRMWLAPHGASQPVTDEPSEAERSRNRRVEIRLLLKTREP